MLFFLEYIKLIAQEIKKIIMTNSNFPFSLLAYVPLCAVGWTEGTQKTVAI